MPAIAPVAAAARVRLASPSPLPNAARMFLDQFHDGRWFVIPLHKRTAWLEFKSTSSRVTRFIPDFAKPVDSPKSITFTDPREYP